MPGMKHFERNYHRPPPPLLLLGCRRVSDPFMYHGSTQGSDPCILLIRCGLLVLFSSLRRFWLLGLRFDSEDGICAFETSIICRNSPPHISGSQQTSALCFDLLNKQCFPIFPLATLARSAKILHVPNDAPRHEIAWYSGYTSFHIPNLAALACRIWRYVWKFVCP